MERRGGNEEDLRCLRRTRPVRGPRGTHGASVPLKGKGRKVHGSLPGADGGPLTEGSCHLLQEAGSCRPLLCIVREETRED